MAPLLNNVAALFFRHQLSCLPVGNLSGISVESIEVFEKPGKISSKIFPKMSVLKEK